LLTNLQQRLFSSIRAFGRTLEVHRKTVLTAFRRGIPRSRQSERRRSERPLRR
jgi:hypothetical protein